MPYLKVREVQYEGIPLSPKSLSPVASRLSPKLSEGSNEPTICQTCRDAALCGNIAYAFADFGGLTCPVYVGGDDDATEVSEVPRLAFRGIPVGTGDMARMFTMRLAQAGLEAMLQATMAASPEQLPTVVLHVVGTRHADDLVVMTLDDFKKLTRTENQLGERCNLL